MVANVLTSLKQASKKGVFSDGNRERNNRCNEGSEMNYCNPAQSYLRTKARPSFFQPLGKQKVAAHSGNRKLLLSIGRTMFVLCPIFLAANLWLASSVKNLEQSVQVFGNVHHELLDTQIKLRAKKDQMLAPERVRVIASQKLSLYVPQKDQVLTF
jgi:hypothetical protein